MFVDKFNPSRVEKTVISIRIETERLRTIDTFSTSKNISRNELILQCIDFALEHINNSSEKE